MTLTKRQRACVIGIANGKTRKEIALELGIARKTVEWHMAQLANTINTSPSNYAAMTHWAIRRGLVKV